MKKILAVAIIAFAVASCAHTKHDEDEQQGGGERVEAPASDLGEAETA